MPFSRTALVVLALTSQMILTTAATEGQSVWHVDDDAPAGGDGTSWTTAFRYLQDALAIAGAGDEIRVAQGIYQPDRDSSHPTGSGSRLATFQLLNGIELKGGYAGLGAAPSSVLEPEQYGGPQRPKDISGVSVWWAE